MAASELRERVTFEARTVTSDGYGGTIGEFGDEFTVSARIRPRLGGEEVMAARLGGRQPVTITVRYSDDAAQITPDWRCRDARTGTRYNIRSVVNPDERKQYLDILAEAGVQT